jgi:hypothetical protein
MISAVAGDVPRMMRRTGREIERGRAMAKLAREVQLNFVSLQVGSCSVRLG